MFPTLETENKGTRLRQAIGGVNLSEEYYFEVPLVIS